MFGFYIIWTDLKSGEGREEFIMALLVSIMMGLAYGLYTATERLA
jgi:hypothetical protein